ncbi:TetR family transcriptional regulator [Streptosporangium carneum]|uniref:TetR family transcriptional regulator n=1 Tax=Streptosporangium carneum TaxID=47481 RepID=A0A9W6MAK3_9ACTN|nr:TetR family transcriptional regulator [Streptosporangium carneum]GLK07151.1 TetR family transcriptional regulator [Streptosporangium carneum]
MRRSSEDTKAAILAAARERFAADGFQAATIRAIASDAGIDPAMVMRYFGNKEKLFAAAADFDLRLPDLTTIPRDEVGRALAGHFMDRWEQDEGMMILLRTGVTNEAVAERMRDIFAGQLGPLIAGIGDAARPAPVRAGLVATQVLGMALCRYVLRLPPVVAMSREDVVDWLGPTLQRYLVGDAHTAPSAASRG